MFCKIHQYTEGLVDLAVLKKHFGETTELLEGQKGTLRIKIKQKVNPDALTDDEMSMVFAGQELPEKLTVFILFALVPVTLLAQWLCAKLFSNE